MSFGGISDMRRRLRKKKHVGEFRQMGFSVECRLRPGLSPQEFDQFTDEFIQHAVEAHGLLFGGGGSAANRIGLGIYDRVKNFVENPEAGSPLAELRAGGWRKLIYRRWKIIYKVRDENIIVGRVWPAAMGEADLDTPL